MNNQQGISDFGIQNDEIQDAETMIVSANNVLRDMYDCKLVDQTLLYKCMK